MNYSSIKSCDFAATSGTRSNASHWGYLPACLACVCLSTGLAAYASETDTESNDNPDSGSVNVERDESQPEVLAAKSYTIRNASSDLCIGGVDGGSSEDGAQLKQFGCDGRDNQDWILKAR